MSDKTPSEFIRGDELVRKSGELVLGQFKYLAGLCSAPIIVVLAFFRGKESEFGWAGKLLITFPLTALVIAGAVFILAHQKQTMVLVHAMLGDEAIAKAEETNPNVREQIALNTYVAWRLGNIADRYAFPVMTVSYALLSVAAIITVWV